MPLLRWVIPLLPHWPGAEPGVMGQIAAEGQAPGDLGAEGSEQRAGGARPRGPGPPASVPAEER